MSLLVSPKVPEAGWAKFRVAHRVLDVAMSEIGLKGACVTAFVGEREAAGVAKHVRMRLEAEVGSRPCPLDHASEAGRSERRAALRREDER